MNKKILLIIVLSGLIIGLSAHIIRDRMNQLDVVEHQQRLYAIQQGYVPQYNTMEKNSRFKPTGFAGNFLASHFAQTNYDWKQANDFLDKVINDDTENYELIKRSMILAIGAGDIDVAASRAEQLLINEPENSFAILILVVKALSDDKLDKALTYLDQMTVGDMTSFVTPLLKGWAYAGLGQYYTEGFNETPFHAFHKAMIAIYMNKDEDARQIISDIMTIVNLNEMDAERVADMYVYLDETEKALPIYQGAFIKNSNNKELHKKIMALQEGDIETVKALSGPVKVGSVRKGAALAFYDMAYLLYRELSDSSAKIFANMALALDPQMPAAYLLLSDAATRNERYLEAIGFLEHIPQDHERYMDSQRRIAELWAEAGETDKAVALLEDLFKAHDDIESLIRIGDLYREEEEFAAALKVYNKAAKQIGEDIPEEYWYLLYARGMTYEREGEWDKAEDDLKAALVYRPNHPYLLNYLGYSWADQGKKLEESKELIQRAVSLRPTDGYIVDSLGWVIYMMGDYKEATPYLERAVELLPYDATINDHLGDALWKVGRKTEARFQWERALNATEDETLAEKIREKMRFGLDAEVKEAKTEEEKSQDR